MLFPDRIPGIRVERERFPFLTVRIRFLNFLDGSSGGAREFLFPPRGGRPFADVMLRFSKIKTDPYFGGAGCVRGGALSAVSIVRF